MNWIRSLLVALGLVLITVTASGAAQARTPDTQGPALVAAAADVAVACTAIGQAPNTVARFTLYDLTAFGGSCVTFYSYGSCTSTYADNEGLYDLRSFGWSDRTSSVRTHNSCDVRFYDAYNCPSQGAQTGWIDSSSNLGTWSNRPSCVLVS